MPLNFIGAGAYEHHIPSAVWAIDDARRVLQRLHAVPGRGQPGHAAALYEYQTMISALTGMEVSNASLYDGGSAVAEASLMAVRAHRSSKSQRILVPDDA